MTPFTQGECEDDMAKRLFNLRQNELRAECTECIFGMWKKRFLIIKSVRNHFKNSLEVVMATASLHNLAVMWNEPLPDYDNEEGEPEDDQEDGEEGEGITGSIRRVRMEGEVLRNTLV